ncbi:MAG: hypothetical protein V7731_01855 [Amphritea sp.]
MATDIFSIGGDSEFLDETKAQGRRKSQLLQAATSGSLYFVYMTSGQMIHVAKAVNPHQGDSFTRPIDGGNATGIGAMNSSSIYHKAAIHAHIHGDTIHLFIPTWDYAAPEAEIWYRTFDTTTDTWGAAAVNLVTTSKSGCGGNAIHKNVFFGDDGTLYTTCMIQKNSMGQAYYKPGLLYKPPGGAWTELMPDVIDAETASIVHADCAVVRSAANPAKMYLFTDSSDNNRYRVLEIDIATKAATHKFFSTTTASFGGAGTHNAQGAYELKCHYINGKEFLSVSRSYGYASIYELDFVGGDMVSMGSSTDTRYSGLDFPGENLVSQVHEDTANGDLYVYTMDLNKNIIYEKYTGGITEEAAVVLENLAPHHISQAKMMRSAMIDRGGNPRLAFYATDSSSQGVYLETDDFFGTASVTLEFTGIPSAEAFGTPTVATAQTITGAGGIPSAEAFGAPVVQNDAFVANGVVASTLSTVSSAVYAAGVATLELSASYNISPAVFDSDNWGYHARVNGVDFPLLGIVIREYYEAGKIIQETALIAVRTQDTAAVIAGGADLDVAVYVRTFDQGGGHSDSIYIAGGFQRTDEASARAFRIERKVEGLSKSAGTITPSKVVFQAAARVRIEQNLAVSVGDSLIVDQRPREVTAVTHYSYVGQGAFSEVGF